MQNITIYTDGSSRGNPGPGGWGAIILGGGEVKELGGREDHTTNNRMELTAAINAIVYVDESDLKGDITVQTDSKYVIQGITSWVYGWQKNGWKTANKQDVVNKDLWEALSFAVSGLKIKWNYVEGHSGHTGNERCDEIATSFADKIEINLYHGIHSKYNINLSEKASSQTKKSTKKNSNAKAYSYVSALHGVVMIHKTWAECEARVKGKSGAKFKKSLSKSDEESLVKEFAKK